MDTKLITATKFAGNIAWIANHAEKMRDRLIQSVAFMAFHAKRHGNKQPLEKWDESPLPGWVRDIGKDVSRARDKAYTEEQAIEDATKIVMFAYMDREERNAKRREQRAASVANNPEQGEQGESVKTGNGATKPSAGKKTNNGPSAPQPVHALINGETTIELSDAEAKALQDYLVNTLRAKPATRTQRRKTRKAA